MARCCNGGACADLFCHIGEQEDDDEVVDASAPLHDQATVLQAEALTARQLRATLAQAGQSSVGARPQYKTQREQRAEEQQRRLRESEARPDMMFYDSPGPKVGESRYIVEQLLDQLGPGECGRGRVRTASTTC
jgi:hypothetical protein